MKLWQIADRLECRLVGDGDVEIRRVIGIEEAGEGDLTFVSNPKYLRRLKTIRASAVILGEAAPKVSIPSLRSDNPYLAFARSIEFFYSVPRQTKGVHSTASIAPGTRIGRNPSIGPYVVIEEDVEVGDDVTLYPHVVIRKGSRVGHECTLHSRAVVREYVRIGDRVILQDGAVIGSDGFGYAKKKDGSYHKILQSGVVILEDDVEVGANTTIDRATIGATIVKKGTKIDNLVQIAHGCVVGENTVIAGQVGLAGSTVVGRNVMLGGQVGAVGHITIGDHTVATARTGIASDVPPHSLVSGYPAIEHLRWRKAVAAFHRIPDLIKQVRRLESRLAALNKSKR
jgi:UDP-3-O-[3-hydroxymyristoyl] glucosamine N-acyltransferase